MKLGEFFDKLAGAEVNSPSVPKQPDDAPKPPRQKVVKLPTLSITGIVFLVVIVGASFFLGALYGKGQQSSSTQTLGSSGSGSSGSNQPQSGGSFGSGSGGGYGGRFYRSSMTTSTVTSISSTSITTQDSSGNTNTYTISSNTLISDNGQQVDSSSISTGSTVIVIPERADPTTARMIIINPQTPSTQQPTTVDPGTSQLE